MNKDQLKGRVKEGLGKLDKHMGRTNRDPIQEDRGTGNELEGKIQKTFGDVKHKIGKNIDR